MKIILVVFVYTIGLLFSITASAGWEGYVDNRVLLGAGFLVGDADVIEDSACDLGTYSVLSFGYSFDSGLSLHLEGQYYLGLAKAGIPGMFYGAMLLGGYHFYRKEHLIDVYGLLGIGYGSAVFSSEKEDDLVGNGPVQIQFGGGVTFEVFPWMELGLETRLGVGVPERYDVLMMGFLGVVVFKLPNHCAGDEDDLSERWVASVEESEASGEAVAAHDGSARSGAKEWPVDADYRVGMGVGIVVGNESKMNQRASEGPWDAVSADLGYGFGGGWAVHLEFQIWNQMMEPSSPLVYFGSLVMSYNFFQDEFFVEPYALAGLGYGVAEYYGDVTTGLETHEDRVDTGPFHFQLGGGATFHLLPFLDLGLETRLRIGVPDNPDVVGMSFLGVLRLRPCRICP